MVPPEKVKVRSLKSDIILPSLTADDSSLRIHLPFKRLACISSGSSGSGSGSTLLQANIRHRERVIL